MRLLLDEMMQRAAAEQLRAGGHEVVAATERVDLRGLPDPDLFERAQAEQRVVVTYNHDDYSAIAPDYDQRRRRHAGLVLVSPRRFPQGASTGELVTALDAFIKAGEPYPSFTAWL